MRAVKRMLKRRVDGEAHVVWLLGPLAWCTAWPKLLRLDSCHDLSSVYKLQC
jgi:hypothetical protein